MIKDGDFMIQTTDFDDILNRFYNRIEKDEDFFNYYNVNIIEAKAIAVRRATNYLIESLDELYLLVPQKHPQILLHLHSHVL